MKKKPQSQPAKNSQEVDYERLGRMLEMTFMSGYADRRRYYRMAFVKGVFTGLGGIIGATIVLAILLWVLSLFETLPFLGPIFENVQDTVNDPRSPSAF